MSILIGDVLHAADLEVVALVHNLRAEIGALRAELREATEAMDDPAINNLVTLPEAIRALVSAYRSSVEWQE